MQTPDTKTKSLKRVDLSVESFVPNELNPNKMSELEFNMLYDNIKKGFYGFCKYM